MDFKELINLFDDSEIVGEKIVIKSQLKKTLKFIKDNYYYNILREIIAIDNNDGTIELVYKLFSVDDDENVLISIFVKDEVESVSDVFDSAVADEKEIYDLFGINFVGNPELKRLYMPESWQGNPLKKDYQESDERLNWND